MNQLPRNLFSNNSFWGHLFGIPLFILGLFLLFLPFPFKSFEIGFSRYSFHVVMISCITLVVILFSRLGMRISRKAPANHMQYYLVCLFEIVFTAGFTGLYLWLFAQDGKAYFMYFGYAMVYLAVGMVIPYIILFQHFKIHDREEQLDEVSKFGQSDKIRFIDERGNVKLIVSQASILYIQSDENYLRIYYLDEGKINSYLLRSSMKRVEDMCAKNGLIRCHRSYFVNKDRVKVLQKDKEFTYAILDVPNTAHIPVSKNYYDQISAIL